LASKPPDRVNSPGDDDSGVEDERSIAPRSRRAFGCVTWVNMAMLVFLASAYVLPLPFRFFEGTLEIVPTAIPFRLTLFGLVMFLPGLALGAVLGLRTYRAERWRSTRTGAGIGAVLGWSSFFVVDRIGGYVIPAWERFFEVGDALLYLLGAVALGATVLVLYALFSSSAYSKRKLSGFAGSGAALLAGLVVLIAGFDAAGLVAALLSTGAGAAGGWVAGIGYARAGGNEMIPPGAVLRREPQPPEKSRKSRKRRGGGAS
jgi:hypothetical protein